MMLLAVGLTTGKSFLQRFAYFLYCFAIWDIFYYVFLYVLINWPLSLLTWDVLFLIPVIWVGPVLAPILISLTMIFLALLIIIRVEKNKAVRMNAPAWIALILGSLVLILSFTWDYSSYLLEKFSYPEIFRNWGSAVLADSMCHFIPRKFNWLIFSIGELIVIAGIIFASKKRVKNKI
jgi:hypothetical protein